MQGDLVETAVINCIFVVTAEFKTKFLNCFIFMQTQFIKLIFRGVQN
jgi:hypothetical protein